MQLFEQGQRQVETELNIEQIYRRQIQMKVALRVLFTKLERFFLKNNRRFVLRAESPSESSDSFDADHVREESPFLEDLIA